MPTMSRIEQTFCRSGPWRAGSRKILLPWALQHEMLSGDVLEIGSGSGAMAAGILERFPAVTYTATDFDEAMVAVAADRLRRYGGRVLVRQADATALPFDDEQFDCVVSFIMLHHVIAWEKALEQAIRVLRPGGLLVGYDLLAVRAARGTHLASRSRHRLMSLPELHTAAAGLPAGATSLRRSLGGLVVRFSLRKDTRA